MPVPGEMFHSQSRNGELGTAGKKGADARRRKGDGEAMERTLGMQSRRQLRLTALLKDIVKEQDGGKPVEMLGVDHRTTVRAEELGQVTARTIEARVVGSVMRLRLDRRDKHFPSRP